MSENNIQFGNCDFSKDISVGQKKLETEEMQKIKYLFDGVSDGTIDLTDGINGTEARQLFEALGGDDGNLTDQELMDICSGISNDVSLNDVNAFKDFLVFLADSFRVNNSTETPTVGDDKTESVTNDSTDCGETRTATVQKWGTGEDDCLSRIMKKAYPDIKVGSADWKKLEEMIMNANPKIYGDENGNGGRKRIIDGTRHNAVLYTGDVITLPPFTPSGSSPETPTNTAPTGTAAPTATETPTKPTAPAANTTPGVTDLGEIPEEEPPADVVPPEDEPELTVAQQYINDFNDNIAAYSRDNNKIMEMLTNKNLTVGEKTTLLNTARMFNPRFGIDDGMNTGVSLDEFKTSLFKIMNAGQSSDKNSIPDKMSLLGAYLDFCSQTKSKNPEVQSTLLFIYNDNRANITFEEFCKKIGYSGNTATVDFSNDVMDTGNSNAIKRLLDIEYKEANKTPTAEKKKLEDSYLKRGGFLGIGKKSDSDLITAILKDYTTNRSKAKVNMKPNDVMYLLEKLFSGNMTKLMNACKPDQMKLLAAIMCEAHVG